jgi:L-ascorbate metabolism protein UlaG (beta-lactamase superfamily)
MKKLHIFTRFVRCRHFVGTFAVTYLFVFAALAAERPSPQQVTVTYLANEGVMIDCAGQKVLIDALFRDSVEDYMRHSPEQQERLETGKAPFDGVRLALATHYHLDHWDAGAISRFLHNNPGAVFASTPEATAMLPYDLRTRVRALRPKPGSPAQVAAEGATAQAFRLGHDHTPNLGYRISICGKTLAHLGDGDVSDASFATLMQAGPVDVAMVPFWWFLESTSVKFITQLWKPRQAIAFHLGKNDGTYADQLRKEFPHVWVCTTQGEARKF